MTRLAQIHPALDGAARAASVTTLAFAANLDNLDELPYCAGVVCLAIAGSRLRLWPRWLTVLMLAEGLELPLDFLVPLPAPAQYAENIIPAAKLKWQGSGFYSAGYEKSVLPK